MGTGEGAEGRPGAAVQLRARAGLVRVRPRFPPQRHTCTCTHMHMATRPLVHSRCVRPSGLVPGPVLGKGWGGWSQVRRHRRVGHQVPGGDPPRGRCCCRGPGTKSVFRAPRR